MLTKGAERGGWVNDTPAKSTAELSRYQKIITCCVRVRGGSACRAVLEKAGTSFIPVLLRYF